LILNDIVEVIYAPVNAFKKVIANPKYLGAIIILLLFVAVSIGYEYAQFNQTYTENTSPTIDKLAQYTNATFWSANPGVALNNNYFDYYNYSVYVASLGYAATDPHAYYNIFSNYTNDAGASSLEFNTINAKSISANISNPLNTDCSSGGFENLSMAFKLVAPQVVPQSAFVTLYVNESNFYSYDLTSSLSSTLAINLWQNLTLPVGPSAQSWAVTGTPSWGNVTTLKLDFTYPNSSNITLRVGALFFHGQFQSPIQYNSTGLLLQFLQLFGLQFILGWFILTGLIYIFFRGLKVEGVTWKPILIALAFAMFVMVIRELVNLVVALTLPPLYYPFDVSLGVRFDSFGTIYFPPEASSTLSASSQAAVNNLASLTSGFRFTVSAMFFVSYVWLGGLCTLVVGTLKPEFTWTKRVIISAVSVAVTVLLLLLLLGVV
jgi:hypothetical protein